MPLLGITMLESIFVQPNATIFTVTKIADGQEIKLLALSAINLLDASQDKAIRLTENRKVQGGFKHQ